MKTKITIMFFLVICSMQLFSTSYIVNTSTDSGAGSLRQAITDANASSSTPHTITFGGSYTITLLTALPNISRTTTIDGGANTINIVGYSASANSISNTGVLTLTNLIFDNLISSYSASTTTTNCTFKNTANAVKVNATTFSATNCTFDSNSGSTTSGASVTTPSSSAIVQLSGCTITNNTGVPAIYHKGQGTGTLTITNCIVSGNTSTAGPAIYNYGNGSGSSLSISNSIISGNTNTSITIFGGGIGSGAATTITNCQISGNTASRGGGIALLLGGTTAKSSLAMSGCTVSGNYLGQYVASAYGGGIYIQGGNATSPATAYFTDNCTFTNCTISGNYTPVLGGTTITASTGGGLEIGGGSNAQWGTPSFTFTNCTITGNYIQGNTNGNALAGGGIESPRGNIVLNYCIIAGNNSNSSSASRDLGSVTSTTGRNLYGGTPNWNSSTTTGNVNLTADISTILNTTLADNGGTTALPDGSYVKTHALVAACAAINPSASGSGMQTTDQRGIVRSTPDMGAYEYVTYRSKASGNWGSTASWQSGDNSTWSDVTVVPNTNVTGSIAIQNGHEITVAANATSPALTVNAGGQLTLNSGASLGVTGNLAINSDADNGTGTVKDLNATGGLSVSNGTTNVQQYISSSATGVTGRNWYISSPLTAATSSTITTATGNGLVYYDGTTNWPDAPAEMVVMKGYIVKSPAQNTTINFNGGTLNTGAQSLVNLPLGFNLVGNPYISSVDFSQATKTNVTNSIWYRSKKQGSYNFHTYNVTGGISINDGTAIIPPMQSFWIKTTSTTNTFGFTNAMRSHQDQSVVANRLKAPKANTQQLLRLRVSNSVNTDETVIYFNPEAQNTVDDYDSQKMFNSINDVPEIFTRNGNTNLVINGMNTIPYDTEIPLGFVTGETGNFSLAATEFNNFDAGTRIILKDKNTPNLEVELSNGLNYSFSSQATTSAADRFSLIFRAPGTTTGINANERMNAQVFVNAANHITIVAPEKSNYAIYNTVGTKVTEGITKSNRTIANEIMCSGVYIVLISGNGYNYSTRIILNSK